MQLNEEATWPSDVLTYLQRNSDLFRAWEEQRLGSAATGSVSGADYDRALVGLRDVLNNHALHGYHCARLTPAEIDHIRSTGMQLPNAAILRRRIEVVRDAGLVDDEIAAQLTEKNQAGDSNSANRIWFCFFPPHQAGQSGIESLLRYWGGEALYNSHDTHPIRGPLLARLGMPCLVEADVPIESLRGPSFLDMKIARQFLVWRGFKTSEPMRHEDCVIRPLAASDIVRVIQFPESDFLDLTRCREWESPLT